MEVGPLPVSCPAGEMEAQRGKDCAYISQSVARWWGPWDRWLKVGASANAKIKWQYVYIMLIFPRKRTIAFLIFPKSFKTSDK